jgi:hypothetical protein
MKITQSQLRQMIKEELQAVVAQEGLFDMFKSKKPKEAGAADADEVGFLDLFKSEKPYDKEAGAEYRDELEKRFDREEEERSRERERQSRRRDQQSEKEFQAKLRADRRAGRGPKYDLGPPTKGPRSRRYRSQRAGVAPPSTGRATLREDPETKIKK